jgi:tRNA-binding EMAP/Myf-like protein
MVTWEDFEKINMRTGTIVEANEFSKGKKARIPFKN